MVMLVVTGCSKHMNPVAPAPESIYHLIVNNGYGDGDYSEGAVVNIYADTPQTGWHFVAWTGDIQYVADVSNSEISVTMPNKDIEITATYAQDVTPVWLGVKRDFVANTYKVYGQWFKNLMSEGVIIEIKLNGSVDPISTYIMTCANETIVQAGTHTRITFVYKYPDGTVKWHYHGLVGNYEQWNLEGVEAETFSGLPEDCPTGSDQWLRDKH